MFRLFRKSICCKDCDGTGKAYPREDGERISSITSLPPTLVVKLGRKNNEYGPDLGKKFMDEVAFEPKLNIDWLQDSSKNAAYELYAISCHRGGGFGGHYYAYVKENGKWYYVNDKIHRQVANDSELFGAEAARVRRRAHLLFYRKTQSIAVDTLL